MYTFAYPIPVSILTDPPNLCYSGFRCNHSRTHLHPLLKRPRPISTRLPCRSSPRALFDAATSPWQDSPFQRDDIIHARYRVTALLGRGSSGVTYEVTSISDPTPLALKVLSFKAMRNWKSLDLFQREVAVLRSLSHPSIPSYIDSFQIDISSDTLFVLVQRKAPGDSLQKLVENGRRFTTDEVHTVFTQLLQILDYLSSLNPPVLHRDVKPANVILQLNPPLSLNLVDFGGVGGVPGTFGSTMVGTFGFMPPEQFGGVVDVRSDMYSAAATVLCMLTGSAPSSLPQKRLKIDLETIIPPRERLKLGNVYTVMAKLLQPAPEDRYDSAREALDALEAIEDRRRERKQSSSLGTSLTEEERDSLEQAFASVGEEFEGRGEGGGPLGMLRGWGRRKLRRRKPAGSRVMVERDRANRLLRIVIPAKGFSGNALSKGAFAVAWTGFTAFWTVGVLTGGAPVVFSLFSLPFWAAGVQMARSTADEVMGYITLVVSFGGGEKEVFYFALSTQGAFGKVDLVEGDSRDLDYAAIETEMYVNGEPVTELVLREGTRRRVLGKGLDLVEQEWLRDEINDFLESRRN